MPSRILGRAPCPECGFESAHVKQSEAKGTLYRYCPECGAQYFPRGPAATERLRTAMRPEGNPPLPVLPEPVAQAPEPVAPPSGNGTAPDDTDPPPMPPPPATARRAFGLFKG